MTIYSTALFQYGRRRTREVKVGDVGVGGDNPIRVQSMTISDTKNTAAVVRETHELAEAGCEIVRITAPTIHHAENLKEIKKQLLAQGVRVPLVADIHFTPQAAMIAADYVEKVRVNPGNYADRKVFAVKEYSDREYQAELDHMAEKFLPLVRKCKSNGVAIRIGTNHGSLSDRIMNRFGDTPEGMVESALEFVRLCESEDFGDIILSMKASSPFIMIQAYRLLAQRMNELGMDYPFHLGVTEAGEGEDGRIKSAIGIGSLLEDGIGDTVRVSLTEDSIHEIPVARQLVKKFNDKMIWENPQNKEPEITWNPIIRERRETLSINLKGESWGGPNTYRVAATWDLDRHGSEELLDFIQSTREPEERGDILWLKSDNGLAHGKGILLEIKKILPDFPVGWVATDSAEVRQALDIFDGVLWSLAVDIPGGEMVAVAEQAAKRKKLLELRFNSLNSIREVLDVLRSLPTVLISVASKQPIQDYRRLAVWLAHEKIALPLNLLILGEHLGDIALEGASQLGGLLVDGLGDSLEVSGMAVPESLRLAFNILQASRLRISKAEFIACPSCGRTLFDLQETTQRIKAKTGHLKGVKIAIMGCIVNGPGEMADADFGYVGGGPGKIHLYVGKECVEKNIPSAVADEKLIDLIKSHGRWVEPVTSTETQVEAV